MRPDLLRQAMDRRLLDLHTAMPAKVVSFDAAAQTITAQPLLKETLAQDGELVASSYPQIQHVPVLYPRCGAYLVAFPLVADDIVTLLFNEWSIDRYREQGAEVAAVDLTRHGLSGAVAIPGGPFPTAAPVQSTIDGITIGCEGKMLLKIKDDGLAVLSSEGGTASEVALANKTRQEIDALRTTVNNLITAYNAHIHVTTATIGASPTPGVISPTTSTASPPAAVGEVKSQKVKVEE